MRLFLAGVLPDDLAHALARRLESVRASSPQARWVAPTGLHLTLLFCGEARPDAVALLCQGLEALASRHAPVRLSLDGAETFGPARAPRVLAARIGGTPAALEALERLAGDARGVAEPLTPMEPPRAFRPHVTIARARSDGDALLGRCRAALADALAGEFVLDAVTLFQSEAGGGPGTAAVHRPLARWTLAG